MEKDITVNEQQRFLYQTISTLCGAMECRDAYTVYHQNDVSRLSRRLAQELGLPAFEIEGIRVAALLHDIGKNAIPAEILTKHGRLHPEEFALIKTHVIRGVEILANVDFPWPVTSMISQHHERLNGSGYPAGLREDDILPGARILAVADVLNAMVKDRPYREAIGLEATLTIFENDGGICFDANVVAALRSLIQGKDKIMMEIL
jgi:putative nucleotidyltransferase with HDIG domain